jgi:hypothetical protein
MTAGERCVLQVERARSLLTQAAEALAAAAYIAKNEKLEDGFDVRALAVARTNAETAELWAEKACG